MSCFSISPLPNFYFSTNPYIHLCCLPQSAVPYYKYLNLIPFLTFSLARISFCNEANRWVNAPNNFFPSLSFNDLPNFIVNALSSVSKVCTVSCEALRSSRSLQTRTFAQDSSGKQVDRPLYGKTYTQCNVRLVDRNKNSLAEESLDNFSFTSKKKERFAVERPECFTKNSLALCLSFILSRC